MKLARQTFGRTDLRVSELCLGTSNFARYADQEESFAILDAFRAAGGNFLQTSGICPGISLGDGFLGLPEELLGRWLHERKIARGSVTIATRIALARPVIGGTETFTALIRSCVDDSLRRIGCEHLDFLVVEWTEAMLPLPETVEALAAVVRSGQVRYIVPANFPPWRMLEALTASRSAPGLLAGVQADYSLAHRSGFEAGAVKICADRDLGVVARSALAGGHLASRRLTSSAGALRHRGTRDHHAAIAAEGLWPLLNATARARRRSPAQIALAWVLAHPQVTSVLVSVRSVDQLRELLAATRVELTALELERLGGGLHRGPLAALAG